MTAREMTVQSASDRASHRRGAGIFTRITHSQTLAALWSDRLTCFSALFLALVAVCALLPTVIAPYDPLDQMLLSRMLAPFSTSPAGFHLLGTDELGRDVLSRLIYGSRVTLLVAAGAVLVSGTIGTVIGLVAGYSSEWLDNLLMRLVDLTMAFPLILLALVLLYVLGPSTQSVVVVLGAIRWPLFARLARASTLSIKHTDYVLAARSIGCRPATVLFKHILPNAFTPLLVTSTLEVAHNIMTESTLSFLGMGVQPPNSSWGLMLAAGQGYIFTSPWLVTIPGLTIFITLLCVNILGMWLRMLNDPLQRWKLSSLK